MKLIVKYLSLTAILITLSSCGDEMDSYNEFMGQSGVPKIALDDLSVTMNFEDEVDEYIYPISSSEKIYMEYLSISNNGGLEMEVYKSIDNTWDISDTLINSWRSYHDTAYNFLYYFDDSPFQYLIVRVTALSLDTDTNTVEYTFSTNKYGIEPQEISENSHLKGFLNSNESVFFYAGFNDIIPVGKVEGSFPVNVYINDQSNSEIYYFDRVESEEDSMMGAAARQGIFLFLESTDNSGDYSFYVG